MADLQKKGMRLATEGVASLLDRLPVRAPALAVLTYHRVAPRDERPDLHPGLSVTPEAFAEQVELLTRQAEPVSLDDVLAAASGAPLPARAVHVTFDDAYDGVEHHAWPILEAAGVPATLFVPTAFPDQDRSFWWDRLHHAVVATDAPSLTTGRRTWALPDRSSRQRAFRELRRFVSSLPHDDAMALVDDLVAQAGVVPCGPATSSWSGIRRLGLRGMALGAHTRTHPILTNVDPDRIREEIQGAFADLRANLGCEPHPAIAYPGGGHDPVVQEVAAAAGARIGFTVSRGVVDPHGHSWLALPRINVGTNATPSMVHLQLHAGPHRVRRLAHRVAGATSRGRTPTPRRN